MPGEEFSRKVKPKLKGTKSAALKWGGWRSGGRGAELRMAVPGSFPLRVEGSWGLDPPKNLSTKLQMYFQSARRSGGGECEVRQEPGTATRFLAFFHLDAGEGCKGGSERDNRGLPAG